MNNNIDTIITEHHHDNKLDTSVGDDDNINEKKINKNYNSDGVNEQQNNVCECSKENIPTNIINNNDKNDQSNNIISFNNNEKQPYCKPDKRNWLPIIDYKKDIGTLLNNLNYTIGVELGVQKGNYALHTLSRWKKCKRYYAVDLWEHQKNYYDGANVNQNKQEQFLHETKKKLSKYPVTYIRNYTHLAVQSFENNSVDYVYVDARHDYLGAKEDIEDWWPIIKPGGLLAGHDFEDAYEVKGQNWSISIDGTDNGNKAVKSAVEEFAYNHGIQHVVLRRETNFVSWFIRKPYI